MTDLGLAQFLRDLAARTPTPGGGSVAALCGALGAALGAMVARYTTGKRYADRAAAMEALAAALEPDVAFLAEAVARDAAAYEAVAAAGKLPRETPEQEAERARRLRAATLRAMEVPLEVEQRAVSVLERLAAAAERGLNPNLSSDAAVAGLALRTCVEGAYRNVRINAESLPGDPEAAALLERGERLRECGVRLSSSLIEGRPPAGGRA